MITSKAGFSLKELAMTSAVAHPKIEEVRRQNLQLLMAAQGARLALAHEMDWTAANVTHFLTGRHRFRRSEAERFCEVLGLPDDWFDTPQTVDTVPPDVLSRLGVAPAAISAALAQPYAKRGRPRLSGTRQDRALAAESPLQELRRHNLRTLTAGYGAKSQLSVLLGTPHKRVSRYIDHPGLLSDEIARRICTVLGLPLDWLDSPREDSDVPKASKKLLAYVRDDAKVSTQARLVVELAKHCDADAVSLVTALVGKAWTREQASRLLSTPEVKRSVPTRKKRLGR